MTTIADVPTGTTWYIVNPGGINAIQHNHSYAGPDRAQAVDRLVALVAQGVDVLPGERFRPNATDAYVAVACVVRIGDHTMLGPADLDEHLPLLTEARGIARGHLQRTCPRHDTQWGKPLSREQQFDLDYANEARWAVIPRSRAQFRACWESIHQGC